MLYQKETSHIQSENDPEEGWHIFVHPATDPWTGNKNKSMIIINTHAVSVNNTSITLPIWLEHIMKLLRMVESVPYLKKLLFHLALQVTGCMFILITYKF
jgi:hypothetical protein